MARFISRRLLLSLVTLWLLATIVFVIANVLPNDVGRTILGPFAPQESVDALNQKLGHGPAAHRPVRRHRCAGVVTLDFGDSYVTGQPVLPQLVGGDRPLGQAGRARPAHHHPDRPSPPACTPRRRRDRPADRAIVLLGRDLVVDPRVRHRHDPGRRRRRPAQAAAGPRHAAAERRHPDPDPLPADAGHGDGDRLLRVHRADDPGRARSRSSSPTTPGRRR